MRVWVRVSKCVSAGFGLGFGMRACADKLCCACRTYRGERWMEWERAGFVLQVSADTDERNNK